MGGRVPRKNSFLGCCDFFSLRPRQAKASRADPIASAPRSQNKKASRCWRRKSAKRSTDAETDVKSEKPSRLARDTGIHRLPQQQSPLLAGPALCGGKNELAPAEAFRRGEK